MPTKVVVVGAGWFGIVAAKTYVQLYPDHDLTILESSSCLGGTWARDRVYTGLKTHNAKGAWEVAGLPMDNVVKDHLTEEGYITGEAVASYMLVLAETYGLDKRIRYNAEVASMTKNGDGEWELVLTGGEHLKANKVIMATGLTSKPYAPTDIPVKEPTMNIIHSVDLRRREAYLTSDKVDSVTVYGGSKSAFDTVFMLGEAGKKVDWIIRTNGSGVSPMFTAKALGMTSALLPPKRLVAAMSPCIFNANSWMSWFLHRTPVGRAIVRFWWKTLTKVAYKKQGLYTTENGRKLIPDLGPLGHFWTASTPAGVISEPNFWTQIHSNPRVTVHRAEITAITADSITLSDSTVLKPDVHIWGTGWTRNSTPITPSSLALSCGAPVPLSEEPNDVKAHWKDITTSAERSVLQMFPILKEAPLYKHITQTKTPYRLYRMIVPPHMTDNSIVFVGTVHTSATGMLADMQALWAAAYLGGYIQNKLPAVEKMEQDIAMTDAWCRKRYLTLAEKCMNCTYEFMPYIDLLLGDLGIESRRKGGFLKEWTSTYTPQDFAGVVEEWKTKAGL